MSYYCIICPDCESYECIIYHPKFNHETKDYLISKQHFVCEMDHVCLFFGPYLSIDEIKNNVQLKKVFEKYDLLIEWINENNIFDLSENSQRSNYIKSCFENFDENY